MSIVVESYFSQLVLFELRNDIFMLPESCGGELLRHITLFCLLTNFSNSLHVCKFCVVSIPKISQEYAYCTIQNFCKY